MHNLAEKIIPARPELEYGTVVSSGDAVVVAVPFGEIQAVRAAGCLIRPEKGDSVLLSVDAQGGAWVLSVLERAGVTPTALEFEGDTVLRIKGGGLTVAPDTELTCVTGKASLHAEDAEVTAGRATLTARLFSSQVELVKHVAGTVDDISREFTRRVVNYFRFTTEHEDCQARSSRQLVEETMTMHSKNTVIVSEEHVKIDGELIHMG
ncbi:MAG: hypothetical protein CVU73_02540 [Deltaproteobacteria bacterium HGW-Deltaproteobacteria-8]|jgi:hypothetical protein|nr:MAG: hypothetical protein CVU73_02540 [Deltaproteobacteria bacterium HGW-Deltaproteobacteria-8]